MIRSMTGFGSATGAIGTRRATVEIRSVNHRFHTATVRLPGDLARFEWEVRELLKAGVPRGHVTLTVRHEGADAERIVIDEQRARAGVALLRELQRQHGLAGDVDVATLLRVPGLFDSAASAGDEDGPPLLALCRAAIEAHARSRSAEGERLGTYLAERLQSIEAALDRVAVRAPERVVAHRDRLRAAVAELTSGFQLDPARLAVEVALLAERWDVGEEIARFRAHLAAFRDTLAARGGEPVGKRLGFLLQEMLREANTTGSKANDVALTEDVVRMKEEIERLREQVENLE